MELKFRVWEKETRTWVEKLDTISMCDFTISDNEIKAHKLADIVSYAAEKNEEYDIVMYTNINDHKGKEIYEGDIVSYDSEITPFSNGEFIGEVKLVDGCFVVENELLEKCVELFDEIAVIKVIGNIYENHEMLEKIRKPKSLEV